MVIRRLAASAAFLGLFISQTAMAAADAGACWRAEEARAARLQNLQNYLMIDAIKCHDTIPSTLASYNDFVGKRRDLITANRHVVQAHFVRLKGAVDGINAETDYETQLGNRLSASGIDVKRCEQTDLYARLAANASDDDLVALAGMLASDVEVLECPGGAAKTKLGAMVIPVWKKPAPVPAAAAVPPAAAPVAAPAIAVTETAAAAPVPAPAAAPVLQPAVATVVAPAPAAPAPTPVPAPVLVAAAAPAVAAVPDADQQRRVTLLALQQAAAALSLAAQSLGPQAPR